MVLGLDTFYAEARVRCGVAPIFREDLDSPPEMLLQSVWQHQRVLRDELRTFEGLPVKVLHPGFLNREGGPDFKGAVVQIGDEAARTGDIEVDLRSTGWRAHGHDRNPAFANVVLHVVWEEDRPLSGAPPLMVLRNALDAPLGELSLWLGGEGTQGFPEGLRGRCCGPLKSLSRDKMLELLNQAAHVRLRSKAEQFQARARQAGWEQSLYEGIFRALGYKHNVWPMQRLAEVRSRWSKNNFSEVRSQPPSASKGEGNARLEAEARLLGISGLLPAELTRRQMAIDTYLRRVWDIWWRDREEYSDCVLPRAVWRLHGLRPANHPHRRLALGAAWALDGGLPGKIERWSAKEIQRKELAESLLEALEVEADEFWSWHWTLRSARLKKAQPLLGVTRASDLAVNVILPWLWIRAAEGKNNQMRQKIEQRYFDWPAAEDNSVLKLARNRLLGGGSSRVLPNAAAQQGLIQIVRDFCDHSNAICENCKFPDVVTEFCRE